MKIYLMFTIFCLSSLIVFSQKLELKKASPFTAVKWENERPIVQFENEWYFFEKLDHLSKDVLLDFCKKQFGNKWKKRFSEDLVDVLKGLNYESNTKVTLQLFKDGVSKMYSGTFTFKNRQETLQYNKTIKSSKNVKIFPQKISTTKAVEDLKQFKNILESRSSYAQISTFDYKSDIRRLIASIRGKKNIDINEFTNEIGKIMSKIGDRHASIKNEAFHKEAHKAYNLWLPFGITTIEGHVVALKQNLKDENYTYYYNRYPNIKSINGIAIETLINTYNYRDKKAPKQAKNSRGTNAIQNYGALLFKNNLTHTDLINVVFSDGDNEKSEIFHLTTDKNRYISKLLKVSHSKMLMIEKGRFVGLSKTLAHNIGYINIPSMYHYDEVEGLEAYIENTLKRFSDTKALIIDIRNNPGGGRAIIQTFASYIVQPEQSPWIANIAYLYTNGKTIIEDESMNSRYLYSNSSKNLTDSDRHAIDEFNENFNLQNMFDTSKFSNPFYMVLHNGNELYTQPVYILVNEKSFSAASVFTSAFKSLPNVKIVGITTDGSSGNSRELYLYHSNIRIKVSTMLSFQRNGETLDGNGTVPDIIISEDEEQVLKGVDNQLSKLIEIINGNK